MYYQVIRKKKKKAIDKVANYQDLQDVREPPKQQSLAMAAVARVGAVASMYDTPNTTNTTNTSNTFSNSSTSSDDLRTKMMTAIEGTKSNIEIASKLITDGEFQQAEDALVTISMDVTDGLKAARLTKDGAALEQWLLFATVVDVYNKQVADQIVEASAATKVQISNSKLYAHSIPDIMASGDGIAANNLANKATDLAQSAVSLSVQSGDETLIGEAKTNLNYVLSVANLVPPSIDCVPGTWSDWSKCSASCGPGVRTQTLSVKTPAVNGGYCPPRTRTKPCNLVPCADDLCVTTDWSEWSECDKECGEGTQMRSREIKKNASLSCPPLIETRKCKKGDCAVDCEVSDWSDWTACTKTCGEGIKSRARSVTKHAADGGLCNYSLHQRDTCNLGACNRPCEMTDWTAWECSTTCGAGTKKYTRSIITPSIDGTSCGPLEKIEECNKDKPCPVNCEYTDWFAWSPCSTTCGPGTQVRKRYIKTDAAHGGRACDQTSITETRACNVDAPCPVDCVFEWDTKCSKPCGGGQQSLKISKPASNNGKACPVEVERACNVDECDVNCQLSDFGECTVPCGGGTQTATVISEKSGAGNTCPPRTRTCNDKPCPSDCELSDFGPCVANNGGACGPGLKSRTIVRPAVAGGKSCGPLVEKCDFIECDQDCEFTWSECMNDDMCGRGTQNLIIEKATKGQGKRCPTVTKRNCDLPDCSKDCILSEYSECVANNCKDKEKCNDIYTNCGKGTRKKRILQSASVDGVQCPMEYQLKEECNLRDCAVDCVVESTWSECSAECGPGVQKRNVVTQETNGGKACPALEMACELGSCNCDSDLAGTYVTAYRTGTPSYDTVPNVAGTIAYDRTERNQCIVNVTPPGSTSFKLKVYGNVLRQGNTAIATWNSSSRSLAWVDSIGYTWVKSITCDPHMAGTYVEYNGGDVSQQVTITMNTNTCTGTVLSSTTTNVSFNGRTIMLPFNVTGTFNPGTGNVADSITFSNGLVWKKGVMPSCPFAGDINGTYNYSRGGVRVATNNSVTMNATTCTGVAVMDNMTYAATMAGNTISVQSRNISGTYDSGSRSISWNDGNTWTR